MKYIHSGSKAIIWKKRVGVHKQQANLTLKKKQKTGLTYILYIYIIIYIYIYIYIYMLCVSILHHTSLRVEEVLLATRSGMNGDRHPKAIAHNSKTHCLLSQSINHSLSVDLRSFSIFHCGWICFCPAEHALQFTLCSNRQSQR